MFWSSFFPEAAVYDLVRGFFRGLGSSLSVSDLRGPGLGGFRRGQHFAEAVEIQSLSFWGAHSSASCREKPSMKREPPLGATCVA